MGYSLSFDPLKMSYILVPIVPKICGLSFILANVGPEGGALW
jgi:hypothetical protein